jgi:hypothetical protein
MVLRTICIVLVIVGRISLASSVESGYPDWKAIETNKIDNQYRQETPKELSQNQLLRRRYQYTYRRQAKEQEEKEEKSKSKQLFEFWTIFKHSIVNC